MIRASAFVRGFVLVSFAAIVAGCASSASREGMTAGAVQTSKKFASTVVVRVTGGTTEGGPTIANDDMKAAIEASIRNSALFKSVAASGGDYELSVFITKLDRPAIGFSFTVDMEAGWSLIRVSDKTVLMRKVVTSSFTATMSDAVVGATRIRLAVEGAARNNITEGLKAIAALDLR